MRARDRVCQVTPSLGNRLQLPSSTADRAPASGGLSGDGKLVAVHCLNTAIYS